MTFIIWVDDDGVKHPESLGLSGISKLEGTVLIRNAYELNPNWGYPEGIGSISVWGQNFQESKKEKIIG